MFCSHYHKSGVILVIFRLKDKKACFESQFSYIILIMFLLYEKVPFRMKPLIIVHANAFMDFTVWIVLAPVHLVQLTV